MVLNVMCYFFETWCIYDNCAVFLAALTVCDGVFYLQNKHWKWKHRDNCTLALSVNARKNIWQMKHHQSLLS